MNVFQKVNNKKGDEKRGKRYNAVLLNRDVIFTNLPLYFKLNSLTFCIAATVCLPSLKRRFRAHLSKSLEAVSFVEKAG